MNIIKSGLINAQYDVLWDDISPVVMDATPRPVLVLVDNCQPGSPESAQVIKMLEACKLRPEQYNVIQISSDRQVAWHKLRERLDPSVVFLIGVLPSQLGISSLFRLNNPNRFNDRVWLPTLSVSELGKYPDAKKQLWEEGMKPIFIDNPLPALAKDK